MVASGRETAAASPQRSTRDAMQPHLPRCQSRPCTVTTVFLPASQVDIRRPGEISDWIGRTIDAVILKIDEERRNIVISRRKMIEQQREEMKRKTLDGLSVGEVDESSIKDRLILGEEGFISVVVVVDSTNGKLVAGPEIYARGSGIDDDGYNEVLPLLEEALDRAAAEGINDTFQIGQLIRRPLGKWVSSNYRRRPMIVPVVLEV